MNAGEDALRIAIDHLGDNHFLVKRFGSIVGQESEIFRRFQGVVRLSPYIP